MSKQEMEQSMNLKDASKTVILMVAVAGGDERKELDQMVTEARIHGRLE